MWWNMKDLLLKLGAQQISVSLVGATNKGSTKAKTLYDGDLSVFERPLMRKISSILIFSSIIISVVIIVHCVSVSTQIVMIAVCNFGCQL